MLGAAGVGRCFDCSHEWDPTAPAPEPVPSLAQEATDDFAAELVELIASTEAEATALLDELIGGTARLEGGQVAQVVSFPSTETVELLLNDGRTEVVNLSDVDRITPRSDVVIEAPPIETVEDYAPEVQMSLTLAELILKAGIASVDMVDGVPQPGLPPVGYLPEEPDLIPVIEQAAALAVGMLIVNLSLDPALILAAIGDPQDPQEATDTPEVTQ